MKHPELLEELGRLRQKDHPHDRHEYGLYRCPFCGKEFTAQRTRVLTERTTSCGCRKADNFKHKIRREIIEKLTREQRAAFLADWRRGAKQSWLCKKYGITKRHYGLLLQIAQAEAAKQDVSAAQQHHDVPQAHSPEALPEDQTYRDEAEAQSSEVSRSLDDDDCIPWELAPERGSKIVAQGDLISSTASSERPPKAEEPDQRKPAPGKKLPNDFDRPPAATDVETKPEPTKAAPIPPPSPAELEWFRGPRMWEELQRAGLTDSRGYFTEKGNVWAKALQEWKQGPPSPKPEPPKLEDRLRVLIPYLDIRHSDNLCTYVTFGREPADLKKIDGKNIRVLLESAGILGDKLKLTEKGKAWLESVEIPPKHFRYGKEIPAQHFQCPRQV